MVDLLTSVTSYDVVSNKKVTRLVEQAKGDLLNVKWFDMSYYNENPYEELQQKRNK